jgi:hypothetical protein
MSRSGSIYGRLEHLEGRVRSENGADMSGPLRPDVVAVLNEYSSMRAMMSDNSYRGSPNGLVKIEPRDVAREFYGGDYTEREFRELAILRALEGLGYEGEQIDERTPELLTLFEGFDTTEGEG